MSHEHSKALIPGLVSFSVESLNAFQMVCLVSVIYPAVWLIGEEVTSL